MLCERNVKNEKTFVYHMFWWPQKVDVLIIIALTLIGFFGMRNRKDTCAQFRVILQPVVVFVFRSLSWRHHCWPYHITWTCLWSKWTFPNDFSRAFEWKFSSICSGSSHIFSRSKPLEYFLLNDWRHILVTRVQIRILTHSYSGQIKITFRIMKV